MSIGGTELTSLNQQQLDSALSNIASLGFKWLRIDFSWRDIQPKNGHSYDWQQNDRIVAAAKRYRIRILGVIGYTPSWARTSDCTSIACRPANINLFAAYAATVANRYKSQGLEDWEIWNEENTARFWKPQPDVAAYTQLLKSSYLAIKRVEPGALVMIGGMDPGNTSVNQTDAVSFLQGIYANGGSDYFDAVAYHPYISLAVNLRTAIGWNRMAVTSPSIVSVLAEHDNGSKQIWITEFGAPTNGPPGTYVSQERQAQLAQYAYDSIQGQSWVGPFFWYTYQDSPLTDTSTAEHFYGLLDAGDNPKAAYYTWKQLLTR